MWNREEFLSSALGGLTGLDVCHQTGKVTASLVSVQPDANIANGKKKRKRKETHRIPPAVIVSPCIMTCIYVWAKCLIQCNRRDIHWWPEPLVAETTFISYCACASLTLAGRGLGWRTSISEWQSSNTLPRKTDSNRHRSKDWSLNTLLNNAVRIHQSQPPSIYNRLVLLYHCRSVHSVISCSLVCIT